MNEQFSLSVESVEVSSAGGFLSEMWRSVDRLDTAVFKEINLGWHNDFLDWIMPWISVLVPLVPVLLAALWIVWLFRLRGLIIVAGLALLFLLSDSVTTQFWRPLFERHRPYAEIEGIRYCFGLDWHISTAESIAKVVGAFGLPSAHAANSMGPAVFLMLFSRRVGWALVGFSVLVGFSRIYLGLHYPGDIIVGMIWGGASGAFMGWVTCKLLEKMGKRWPQAT